MARRWFTEDETGISLAGDLFGETARANGTLVGVAGPKRKDTRATDGLP
jgi:hypothetical protein